MWAGCNKIDFGSECIRLHAMGLESLPHSHALGQMNFCQAAQDWALKALASFFCRSGPFSDHMLRPSLPWERCQMQVLPCQDDPKPSGSSGFARWELVAPIGVGFGGGRWGIAGARSFPGGVWQLQLSSLQLHNTLAPTTAIA